ncbi:20300_t:CDS:2 [Cetraspora pellucida]|uniref:20300_t:CDS:1 n=1 Tax=Cetraspora pellucida TaxID=1433469 RepID=A0A9N8W971_9GLOM|nr:20300_t:CDS:2 [Cetraspora pellucida]
MILQYSKSKPHNTGVYDGYDYSTYGGSSYYYPTTGVSSAPKASTATVVEAPPAISGIINQQVRGIGSGIHQPKDDIVSEHLDMQSEINKQSASKKETKVNY